MEDALLSVHKATESDRRYEHEAMEGDHRQGDEAMEGNRPRIEILMVDQYSEIPAANLDFELRMAGLDALLRNSHLEPVEALAALAKVLHIEVEWDHVRNLHIVTLLGITPELPFSSPVKKEAAMIALKYMRGVLENIPNRPELNSAKSL